MATAPAVSSSTDRKRRVSQTWCELGRSAIILWHLLSLDAPTVAAVWTWFVAESAGIRLPLVAPVAMFVTVWMLYVGDRLLDARQLFSDPLQTAGLEARHLFHHRHRAAFLLGIVVASITLAGLLPRIQVEALHLYLVLGSVLIGYFLLIHGASKAHRLPKELAVGFFFAAATFIPTVAGHPQLRVGLLAPALLLASVCSLNCLFIFAWEHEPKGDDAAYVTAHATTRFAARNLPLLAGLVVVAGLLLALFDQVLPWHFFAACTGSAVLLLFLHRQRRLIDATLLRSAADLALLTPIVFLLVMHR